MSRRLAGFALLALGTGGLMPPARLAAQPPQPAPDPGPQSPLDLARGLRDAGMPDLALDYLKELAARPVPDAVKAELPFERARTLADAADAEPDEVARANLGAQARAAFAAFLRDAPDHPRAAEGYLALARLAALDGKALLGKARRIDLPADGGAARDEAADRQRAEAAKARPRFDEAAKRFEDAAKRIDAQLGKAPGGPARRDLDRARYDARLEAGVSRLARADTYLHPTAEDRAARAADVDGARETFAALARDTATPPRVAHVARAWMAECLWRKDEAKAADEEAGKVMAVVGPEADDGKRVVRFHRVKRRYDAAASEKTVRAFDEAEKMARDWLRDYGRDRRAAADAVAARWFLASALQTLADAQMPPPPKTPPKAGTPEPPVPAGARSRYAEAERLYRLIAQTDTEYASRAARQRMVVVRRLIGDANQPASAYGTFEEAQMAALIQLGKVAELEKAGGTGDEVKERRQQVVALLERARELATPADSPADLADVNLRLVVQYAQTGRPDRAAVLGEAVARAARPGTRPATAGALAVNAYAAAAQPGLAPDRLDAARKADRDRAARLARYLDDKFPADPATDRARHRLAALLYDDGKSVEALQILFKVQPGYDDIGSVRLFEGGLASQVLAAKDLPLADDARRAVFRQVVEHLGAVPAPPPNAPVDDAREYLTARCRLALLYLLQPRTDPEAEKAEGGYAKARKVAEEAVGLVPTFASLVRGGTKEPNPDGLELLLLAEDARTRAALLAGQGLFTQGKYDDAYAAVAPVLAEMKAKGPYAEVVKKAAGAAPPAMKKDPAPKKEAEPKKEEPKKDEGEPGAGDDPPGGGGEPDPDAAVRGRSVKLAEGIDRFRRELVLLAVKIRVKQGRADQGVEQLDLLRSYGGGLDSNPAALRQLAADLGGQVRDLRRAGKPDEARALADAFGKLLGAVAAAPNLPPSTRVLVGQALSLVGEYDKAEVVLKAVPAPADPGLLAKPAAELDEAARRQVADYRRAVLELIRALRLGKKYAEAEAQLQGAVGPPGQPGWGANSLEFRKELALLAEARGAEATAPAEAKKYWSEAVKEWDTIARAAGKRLETPLPKGPNGQPDNAALQRNRNAYYDAFFDSNRCVVVANQQLLKGNPKLQAKFDTVGKKFAEVERAAGNDLTPEVRARYADFLAEQPELKKAYEAAGGKLFLERPPGGM